jgi:hypothetical protein
MNVFHLLVANPLLAASLVVTFGALLVEAWSVRRALRASTSEARE